MAHSGDLALSNAAFERARTALVFLQRRRVLGEGMSSFVLEGSRPDRVLKVTADPMSWRLLCDPVLKVRGRAFPKVHKNYGRIATVSSYGMRMHLYAYEIERLVPVRGRYIDTLVAVQRADAWFGHAEDTVRSYSWRLPRYLQRGMLELHKFCAHMVEIEPSFAGADLHDENLMLRELPSGGSELVLCDPVATTKHYLAPLALKGIDKSFLKRYSASSKYIRRT